ncbi:alkaline phosphatase D family protein [Saccharicrinis sp. 156]|uniref:alkaline phosphatase D family protein n=1 Tax=Saccharicrinis sp. 156 TaxID=3417574 RepID=UPI003D3571B5
MRITSNTNEINNNMKDIALLVLVAFLFTFCQADRPENKPELRYTDNAKSWYNRKTGVTKYLIEIANGNPKAAIEHANKQGIDAEACFVKALAFARMGNADSAMANVHKSLNWGLSIDRYQGPHEMLVSLNKLPQFKKFIKKNGTTIVHGPMIGHTTSSTAKIWLRTSHTSKAQIVLSENRSFDNEILTAEVQTSGDSEYTAKLDAKGLMAKTTYFYKVKIDGKIQDKVYEFTTQAVEGQPGETTVAFGGGAAYIPWHSYMWNTLKSHNLNAMLLLGDNVYIDYPENAEIQRYCYFRRQSKPEFRDFSSGTPILSIWDDHDFGDNDEFGGKEIDSPKWKRPVFEVFRNQFANPYYGGGDKNPGIWYDFQMADIDFFMLDCRYYREPSSADGNIKDPQMLGPVQLKWLKEKLLASKGTFKVIVSSVPWAYGAKAGMAGRFDTWRGYKKERKEIFDFLAENKIEGVVLLSADRHRSDLWKIERENGYPLYEMESSKLINTHTHDCMDDPERILCYREKCSFGKLIFNTTSSDPTLRYEIWSIDNEKVEAYTIKLSELKH